MQSMDNTPSGIREYLTITTSLWGNHIAGPVLAFIAIAFTMASAFLSSDSSKSAMLVKWSAWLTAAAAIVLVFRAQYDAWSGLRAELDKERSKNEAAPHMEIRIHNAIPRGSIGVGMTDLFVNLELVLEEPSRVSIRDFALTIFDNNQSSTITAVDDVGEWEVVKKTVDGGRSHIQCVPLVRELTQRGDPVQGWIHFPIPALPDSVVQRSGLTVKINGVHGTCYYQLQGAYARPDPDVKGTMRKVVHDAAELLRGGSSEL